MHSRAARALLLFVAATLPITARAQNRPPARASGSFQICKTNSNKALHDVEVRARTVTLPATERARYDALHAALGAETSLAECQARRKKIDSLIATFDEMATLAAPATRVGVKGQGGVVVRLRSGSTPGLVAYTSDQPVMGGMVQPGAETSCHSLVANGHSDWYLPSADDISAVWQSRAAIGGFKDSEFYWTSTRVHGQDYKAMARRWATGETYSWDTNDNGPSRALFQGRCVRKF